MPTTEEKLLAIEEAAAREVAKPVRQRFIDLVKRLHTLWPGDDASPEAKQAALSRLNISAIPMTLDYVGMLDKLADYVEEAQETGVSGALAMAAVGGIVIDDTFKRKPSEPALVQASRIPSIVQTQVTLATRLATGARTLEDAETAVMMVQGAANRIEGVARWATNKAANDGIAQVSDQDKDLVQVWKPERDACVHCLAYAGEINVGKGYKGGLTYGKTPLINRTFDGPPLHPNCRCTQVLWSPKWKTLEVGIPEALRREAQRAILRGWSVQSESNSVRIYAAQKLLNRGSQLPKSVKDYAAKAIKRGEFPRGREFPR